jgi:hypothetical protein
MILFRISDIRGCNPTVRFKEPCPDQGDDPRSVRSEDPPRSSHDIHEVSNLTKIQKVVSFSIQNKQFFNFQTI